MSAPATTIKQAVQKWEEKHPGENLYEMEEVGFQFQCPPIEKMDNTLSTLTNCKKLSLSTNMIEKITGLNGMKHLKILSLARNAIKSLSGIETVADTLEQLWISYNLIEKTKGITVLQRLKVLYIGHNKIKEWKEFANFQELPELEDFLFVGNPLYESTDEAVYKVEAKNRLKNLKVLEGELVASVECIEEE